MARTVPSREALDNAKDDLIEEGWSVSKEATDKVVMRDNDYGSFGAHSLVFLLTVWWTFGFGNLLYAAKRFWMNSRKRVIRVQE